jgi:hypothetical protein
VFILQNLGGDRSDTGQRNQRSVSNKKVTSITIDIDTDR